MKRKRPIKKLNFYNNVFTANEALPIRQEVNAGIAYTVVPVTMMTVGVHAGSDGPVLYTANELSKFHQAWNGVPVCMQHPQIDGVFVSCNQPQFFENQVVGKIFNTVFEDNKLKAEAWLETDKSAGILSFINSGNQLEVSTGLFSDGILTPGDFGGVSYTAIVNNIVPDHLALLPGGTGACSWQDGCGVRANEGGDDVKKGTSKNEVHEKKEKDLLFNYLDEPNFVVNEMDYTRLVQMMRSAVNTLDVPGEKWCYLRRMFENYIIYEAEYREGSDKLYKRNYNIVNDEVQWTSDPIQVTENVTYPEVTTTNEKGESTVTKKKDEVCCIEEVKAFVANEDNKYNEADVEWLSVLPETGFRSIVANTNIEKVVTKTVEVPAEAKTIEELIANASPELQESIRYGQQVLKEQKTQLIAGITANKNNKFSPEYLQAADIEFLKTLSETMAVPVVNFALQNGGPAPRVNASHAEEPMEDLYADKVEK